MIIVNFSHPLSDENTAQIELITRQAITGTLEHLAQLDSQLPFAPQVKDLVSQVELESRQWQTEPILVVLPAQNFIAALVLAELEGRLGHLPTIVRIREAANVVPRRWEVAEIIDLQLVREQARSKRIL